MKEKQERSMLVFHCAYTFDFLKENHMEIFVKARDATNLFDYVLTVNPIANLQYLTADLRHFSRPRFYYLDQKNLIIEASIGRFKKLILFPRVNFALAQLTLFLELILGRHLKNIKLVRAEDPRLNGLYALIFSRLLRKPLVVGVWGNPGRLRQLSGEPNMPRLFKSSRAEERLEGFVLRRANIVLVQNKENLSYVLGQKVDPRKTRYTQLGVGIDRAHFLPAENRQDVSDEFENWNATDSIVITCISRLEKSKNVDHAILACKSLKARQVNFKLLLVGDGREKQSLQRLIENEGLNSEVIFAGNRSQDWISGALKLTSIYVSPLCGRALLEAGLAGLPTVAYDVDWHSDLVLPNETGFLASNLNYEEMGSHLLRLCLDSKLRNEFGEKMQCLATDMANPTIIALRQREIYEQLID